MNGLMRNDRHIMSNARWDEIFELLHFMMNDIYPDDFKEYCETGIIRDYFKNKYLIELK
jgi:malate synthase